jgi:hypothetical protein
MTFSSMLGPGTRFRWSRLATGMVALVTVWTATGQEPPEYGPTESKPLSEIIVAVRQQDYARIESLLANGADPTLLSGGNSRRAGPSAWVWAVLLQDNHSLNLLLQHTKALNKAPMADFGFVIAVTKGNLEAVRLLLDKSIPVDVQPFDGATPLLLAAGNADTALIRLLLEKGADVNHADPHGDTPLMAAVRAGPLDAVRALLDGGAKPEMKDKQGRAAVQWAAHYGREDLVNLLRSKGAAAPEAPADPKPRPALDTPRQAATRTLPMLQRGAASWTENASCVSCHHQFLMPRVAAVARRQGFALDAELLLAQDTEVQKDREKLLRMIQPALTNEAAVLRVTTRGGTPLFEVAYSLAAVAEDGFRPDGSTEKLARFLAVAQTKDGNWQVGLPRIPLKSSDFTTTACAIRALQMYAPSSEAKATPKRVARAAAWLEKTKPVSTEDKVFRLRGLKWAKADQQLIDAAVKLLNQEQHRDGGWGQMPEFNSDAYATGETLTALRECGDVPASDSAFQRGIRYLLQTQELDGSWLVHKRAVPFNGYLESGFPHGKFQITSYAGTCWATMALMLAEPAPAGGSSR